MMKFWKLRHGTFSVEDSSVHYLQKLQDIDYTDYTVLEYTLCQPLTPGVP